MSEKPTFDALFAEVEPRIRKKARFFARLIPFETEDDIYQEMSIAAWGAYVKWQPGTAPVQYSMWTYAKWCAGRMLKTARYPKWAHKHVLASVERASDTPNPMLRHEVRKAIGGLPARTQDVLFATVLEGQSFQEYAQSIGLTKPGVASAQRRALINLKEKLTAKSATRV